MKSPLAALARFGLVTVLAIGLLAAVGCEKSGGRSGGPIAPQTSCAYDKNPVDEQFAYETKAGRKIGFCSKDCLKKFKKDRMLNPDLRT